MCPNQHIPCPLFVNPDVTHISSRFTVEDGIVRRHIG
jgi:hypothetical protein